MFKFRRSFLLLFTLIFILSACNLPSGAAEPSPSDPNAIFTAAAETASIQLTQAAVGQPATQPPPTSPPLQPPTLAPSATPIIPTMTPTQQCDKAFFIKDVNIPDGTTFAPGDAFTKTWRIKNAGTCTWSGYLLVFDSGDLMGGPASVPIGSVAPGQEVDLSVNLTAPASPGSYRGYWRIRNASGVLLPIPNGYQDKSFFVDIKVGSSGFDLYTRAPDAEWVSSAGNITFGGPDSDANGFAMYKDGVKLEDGSTPNKVVETHPQWVNDGVISGLYDAYTVVPGERFRAKIGFIALADGSCGAGSVIFQLNYKKGGTIHPLGSWTHTCDGSLINLDVDLSGIAGQNVQFAIAVLADGTAAQDWAVWVNPRVELP